MADTDYLAASDGTGDAALMHVTTPRTAGATIIQVDTVSGVPAFFIGTWGTLGSDGFITAASKRDFFGHVNAGTLVIDKMAPGNTDAGNTSGQVVIIKPSTPTQNLVGNFVKTALNNFGEGQLLNGKIVPSISSNNLVLSIKTLAGVDPSTTDVVYVRIGNTVRSITAALSVTLAAGTNWFSKGTAPLATIATTFFAYLGYNATDGVVLGVSSHPTAIKYGDFSTTNTDWTYAKISTITNAVAADVYENIGRFNAILGVSATYLWTLPANNIAISIPSQTIQQIPCDFSVYRAAAFSTTTNPHIVPYDTKLFDLGANVDIVTNKGRFTAPVTGLYFFNAESSLTVSSAGFGFGIALFKNGSAFKNGTQAVSTAGSSFQYRHVAAGFVLLIAGDYVEAGITNAAGVTVDVGNGVAFFEGFLKKQL